MPETRSLGDRISNLRTARNETQAEFAASFEVTQPMVSAWEGGRNTPSPAAYIRLGNRAPYPDNVWFWERAGISMDAMLPVAETIINGRIADAGTLQTQGSVVLVPPFTQGEWERQLSLAPLPVPAEAVLNKASTFYLIATSWGSGFAPRDRVVFDTAGAMRKVGPFDGADVVLYSRWDPARQSRRPAAGDPRGEISVGRIRIFKHPPQGTYALFTRRDRTDAGLVFGGHEAHRVIGFFGHPGAWTVDAARHRTMAETKKHEEMMASAHSAMVEGMTLDKDELLGRFIALVNGRGQKDSDKWEPSRETFEKWIARG